MRPSEFRGKLSAFCLELSKTLYTVPQHMVSASEENPMENSKIDNFTLSSCHGISSDDFDDLSKQIYRTEQQDDGENQESAVDAALKIDGDDYNVRAELRIDSGINSRFSEANRSFL